MDLLESRAITWSVGIVLTCVTPLVAMLVRSHKTLAKYRGKMTAAHESVLVKKAPLFVRGASRSPSVSESNKRGPPQLLEAIAGSQHEDVSLMGLPGIDTCDTLDSRAAEAARLDGHRHSKPVPSKSRSGPLVWALNSESL